MNVTVKHIRGTACPLICETTCLASVGTQLTAADTALISRRVRSEDLGLESSLGHAILGGLVGHSSSLFNPCRGWYFASLKCALTGVGNNFPISVNVLIMKNEVSPWQKVDKEGKV